VKYPPGGRGAGRHGRPHPLRRQVGGMQPGGGRRRYPGDLTPTASADTRPGHGLRYNAGLPA